MTAPKHDVVFVDLIEDEPMSREEFCGKAEGSLGDALPALKEEADKLLDQMYRRYLETHQPWRWHSTSEGNHKVLAAGERYFNEADAEANIRKQFGADTIVYLRRAERGNEVLRMPPPVSLLDGTTEFMRLAKQPAGEWIADPPMTQSGFQQLRELRRALLREEFFEYLGAEMNSDLVEIVDGLLDVIVIAWGTLITYVGEDRAKAAAAEVVRSNLDKVIGDGLPIFREDGKVLKPEGWTAPDIAGAIA